MLLRLGAHAVLVCPGACAAHMRSGTLTERRPLGTVLGAWSGREGGLGRGSGARVQSRAVAPLQWRLVRWRQAAHLWLWRQSCRLVCDMGLAARMLSSELEMYPMIAVAHEIAMVRTAGSICMARSAPGSLGPAAREPAAAPAERAANFERGRKRTQPRG